MCHSSLLLRPFQKHIWPKAGNSKNLIRKLGASYKFSSPVWQMQEFLIIIKTVGCFLKLIWVKQNLRPFWGLPCIGLNRLQTVIVLDFESDFICCAHSSSQQSKEAALLCHITHTHMFAFSDSAVWSSTMDSIQVQKITYDTGEYIQVKQRLLAKLLKEYQGWDFSTKG